ncbi:hypothetical protein FKW77_006893 [Venturia effusa]|uniref:RBR-type E3 ubiquitin transferase n=1 Tax=Venturia effusa TaxID=50376 RepID=A0A517LJ15_9PEZI|nr:hypothetical protein FKW77_006893 [Venturia effusa]
MATLTIKSAHPIKFDDEMMALALQLEEIECQPAIQKGKYKADSPPDLELAFTAFQKEVQMHIQFLNDLNLAHSIARAVDTDAQAIAASVQVEGREERDRRLALQLGGQNPDDAPPPYVEIGESLPAQSVEPSSRLYAELQMEALKQPFPIVLEDDQKCVAGPSTSYADRQLQAFEKLAMCDAQCIACDDNLRNADVMRAPCGCVYCRSCLKTVFLNAAKDEELFPPRCCREPIPLELVAPYMSREESEHFKKKQIEYSTQNRTYCCNRQCGEFVHPAQVVKGDGANCSQCGTVTCVHCKQAYHYGDCPEDEAMQTTLALARELGWQRCFNCQRMVGLYTGCNHITYVTSFPDFR